MSDTKANRADRLRRLAAVCRWLAMVGFWLAPLLVVFTLVIGRIEKVYDDLNRQLSLLEVFVINLGWWLGGRLYPDQAVPALMWILPLVMVGLLACMMVNRRALHHRRLLLEGHCDQCGYDLRGTLAAGRKECPECGAVIVG